ncbi:hypothetical protein ABZ734_06115 [Streptomyces sp. NPDC006660]|uniref:hypothetical protein n=1 Tax=Streptomyces sp. NPDC006660 TaxID=3156901 RepID=UPI0033FEF2ED
MSEADWAGRARRPRIDYGFLGQWTNPRTGERHRDRVWAFVMVLPCSATAS